MQKRSPIPKEYQLLVARCLTGQGRSFLNVSHPRLTSGGRSYYDILEVTPKAKKEDIKEAYRRLAKKYHPDRNVDDPEAETRFKEVQEAHATLSDSWKKALYDQDSCPSPADSTGGSRAVDRTLGEGATACDRCPVGVHGTAAMRASKKPNTWCSL
eukprot:Skav207781  [mRNA]  locus=scaffold70:39808:49117:+ [translate_table: standard]